ncbi:MAG TPA: hypothetical protein ENK91_08325 [Bacteroidetes bacterium]|nr:hypothetical protein [Bacteroidota bacterium]
MSQEYPMWMSIKEKMITKHNGEYNLLFIGDSRAKTGLIPQEFDSHKIKTLNLSIGGGTPIEGYYSLKYYLENNSAKSLEYLLISYAPFHLMFQDSYWNRTVRFDFLAQEDYKEVIKTASKLKDYSTLGDINSQKSDVYTGKYLIEFIKGMALMRWKTNKEVLMHLETSQGHYFFGRNDRALTLNQETGFETFQVSQLLDTYFRMMVDLARQNNIKVFYYTMPFSQLSYHKTTPKFINAYNTYIETFVQKYGMVNLNTLNFCDDSYFGDASHLYKGSRAITSELRSKVLDHL